MRLVEDDGLVLGKDRRVGLLAQAEIGEVEGVVDDDEIGCPRVPPGLLREAVGGERALAAEAAVGADRELAPERVRGLEGELGPVAGLGLVEPGHQPVEVGRVLLALQQLAAQQAEAVQRLAAEVVLPSLEHGHLHLATQGGGGDRDVLREQLLLQRLRRGRDDDPAARLQRRDEIGEALPGPCARFGKQVLARPEGVGHGPGELGLLRPRLVAEQDLSDRAPDAEDVFHARQRMTRGGGRREKFAPSALFRPAKPLTEAACAP